MHSRLPTFGATVPGAQGTATPVPQEKPGSHSMTLSTVSVRRTVWLLFETEGLADERTVSTPRAAEATSLDTLCTLART